MPRASKDYNLRTENPELAKEWHPSRNGDLQPEDVTPGSKTVVWWECNKKHEWETSVYHRNNGTRCPECVGKKVGKDNNLLYLYPEVAKEWHPTKNGDLSPKDVTPGMSKSVWWLCSSGHEWKTAVHHRVNGSGCRKCSKRIATANHNLAVVNPELAKEWHPSKNGNLTPSDVAPSARREVYWLCDRGHEWEASMNSRSKGHGCPECDGKRVGGGNSLAAKAPHLVKEWHPTKNKGLTPQDVTFRSSRLIWWICSSRHEWEARVGNRYGGHTCPECSNRKLGKDNNLKAVNPELAQEWHPTKNGDLRPQDVFPGSNENVWWCCSKDLYEWQAVVNTRSRGAGCPRCQSGWRADVIINTVQSIGKKEIENLTQAERYAIFLASGAVRSKHKDVIQSIVSSGKLPDDFIEDEESSEIQADENPVLAEGVDPEEVFSGEADNTIDLEELLSSEEGALDGGEDDEENELPEVAAAKALEAGEAIEGLLASADEETLDFLVSSRVDKLWKEAFRAHHPERVAEAVRKGPSSPYLDLIKEHFLSQYDKASSLELPPGYSFRVQGEIANPNLMQKLIAVRLRDENMLGNWSGTGAGKTLSAILASRVSGSDFTLITCPNAVVATWEKEIRAVFPDAQIETKTLEPSWQGDPSSGRFLILNYERFQQPESEQLVANLLDREVPDCFVIDEVQFAKERSADNVSKRKEVIVAMLQTAREIREKEGGEEIRVLAMSATPVINNLHEGRSMVELITGQTHDDIETRPSVANCMRLYQHLSRLGLRWMPDYEAQLRLREEEVSCDAQVEEIRALGKTPTPLQVEQVLTEARIPTFIEELHKDRRPTLLYTMYIDGIGERLREALEAEGFRTGFYTGDNKEGLARFLRGEIDVLIATAAIATGVDGLQHVCDRIFINALPWTHAEYQQLIGRVWRQGQKSREVEVIIPRTSALVEGEEWSWCRARLDRINFKASLADSAVDGVVPKGMLQSPAKTTEALLRWLDRLERGETSEIERERIIVPLPPPGDAASKKRIAAYGDFSKMNRHWNTSGSETTHKRLQDNPEEWQQYHTLYREAREKWEVVPFEEMIRYFQKRSNQTIADFGCGEALLAEALRGTHTVYSFDHIAINDDVIACDMAHTPLGDEELDAALFCLSLMGSNMTDYLLEAARTLKLDGRLHIIEPKSRFSDDEATSFRASLKKLGFAVSEPESMGDKFWHISAFKDSAPPKDFQENISL